MRSTPANETLRAEVVALGGEPPTDSQLSRWVTAGAIHPPVRHALGRGRGTTSAYPSGAPARAIKVKELLDAGLGLSTVPAALFALGEEEVEAALRASLAVLLDDVDRQLQQMAARSPGWPRQGDDPNDLRDVADAVTLTVTEDGRRPRLVSRFARNLSRDGPGARGQRAEGKEQHGAADVQDALLSMLTGVWAARALDDEALLALLAAFGLPEEVAITLERSVLADMQGAIANMSLPIARRKLRSGSPSDMREARQTMNDFLQVLQQAHPDLESLLREWAGPDGLALIMATLLPNTPPPQ